MKKSRRKILTPAPDLDWDEFGEMHALENRLGELLLTCEGIAIGMNNDFVIEVWGKLRYGPGAQMVRLAAVPGDLREAVRLAHEAAHEFQMPPSIQLRTQL